MMKESQTRLAVLGSPIGHTKSPALQSAAYGELGLPWRYQAADVPEEFLPGFLGGLDDRWRGLSLTMPLKRAVMPLLAETSPTAQLVGAANTIVFDGENILGWNTDVTGVIDAFAAAGVRQLETVVLLGAGATAASVMAAVARMGARRVVIVARSPEKARGLHPLAARLGIDLGIRGWGVLPNLPEPPDAVVSTLPGHAAADIAFPDEWKLRAAFFDVAYEPWPSAFAAQWLEVGGTVVPGLWMLLYQAFAQVRIFVTGEEGGALDREDEVLAAMRASVGI